MKAEDLCIFLSTYTLCLAFASILEWARRRSTWAIGSVIVALIGVSAATAVGYHLDSEKPYPQLLLFLIRQRDFSALVSSIFGVVTALGWIVLWPNLSEQTPQSSARSAILAHLTLWISILGVFGTAQLFIWKELRGVKRDPAVRVLAPEFTIEKVADLEFLPVRIAVSDEGRVFVTYTYYEAWGDMGGAIVEVSPDATSDSARSRIVADSPLLLRSYGLAVREGDLFVSRTGIASHATQGRITYDNTAAITRLRDLDGDGYFEYAEDLVTGLPGSRGPDTMHQTNGIAFAPDGSLFVTSASSDDRALDNHPWGSSILRCSPDFSQTEVFASGFRNPFGIAFGPEQELFVTDNDVDENPGDELNHVVQGAHYGHPFVVPNERSVKAEGFTEPILLSGPESNYLGLAYATSTNLPAKYRDCFYMTDFMENKIWRLRLARDGATFRIAEIEPFATISSPVDIAISPAGDIYCVSRRTQNVYRIRPKDEALRP